MKKRILSLATIIVTCFSPLLFAANDHYRVIVDAGSSGSRLHLFQYEKTNIPIIQDIFSESTKPGLSSFADHPAAAGESLKKLLDDAAAVLQKKGVDPATVSVNVLATAGMRLLPESTQHVIYDEVKKYITAHYVFQLGEVNTISGKMEGLYGWMDINYLLGNFQAHQPTQGSIDMGGASTQIAFATHDYSKPEDEITFDLAGTHYTVFSKSFLGLGQDEMSSAMTQTSSAAYCYPTHYEFSPSKTGNFFMPAYSTTYHELIAAHSVKDQLLPFKDQPFIAYSGIYYTFHFFDVDKSPNEAILTQHIQQVCQQPWEELKVLYPNVPDKYLSTYCANAVYEHHLLYKTYHLQDEQLHVTNQINQTDIDWALGAALYQLVSE